MRESLVSIGYYTSPLGGAPQPALIGEGYVLFEMIMAGSVYAPGSSQASGPGSIFAHQGGDETVWQSDQDEHYECLVAQFHADDLLMQHEWPRHFQWSPATDAVHFAQEILTAFHQNGIQREVIGALLVNQFAMRMYLHQQRQTVHRYPAAIAKAVRYLNEHFQEEVNIQKLTQHAGMSESHLHNSFKTHLGVSPHQYLIGRRMRRARHQLATTLTTVATIADEIGYANTESFCRAFKKLHDMTATAYRLQHSRSD